VVLAAIIPLLGCGVSENEDAAKFAPAAVVRTSDEGALERVYVWAEAEGRLGIATAPLERRRLPRTRTLGGDVVVPTRLPGIEGRPLVVGTALAPADRLHAMDTLVTADEAVQRARIEVEVATAALARASGCREPRRGASGASRRRGRASRWRGRLSAPPRCVARVSPRRRLAAATRCGSAFPSTSATWLWWLPSGRRSSPPSASRWRRAPDARRRLPDRARETPTRRASTSSTPWTIAMDGSVRARKSP
jgi:hypothetical protein